MTIKEAILAVVQLDADDILLDKALSDIDETLIKEEDYDKTLHEATVDLVAINVLNSLMMLADISEGDYSIKYDKASMLRRISSLEIVTGTVVTSGAVKDVSYLW